MTSSYHCTQNVRHFKGKLHSYSNWRNSKWYSVLAIVCHLHLQPLTLTMWQSQKRPLQNWANALVNIVYLSFEGRITSKAAVRNFMHPLNNVAPRLSASVPSDVHNIHTHICALLQKHEEFIPPCKDSSVVIHKAKVSNLNHSLLALHICNFRQMKRVVQKARSIVTVRFEQKQGLQHCYIGSYKYLHFSNIIKFVICCGSTCKWDSLRQDVTGRC